jgi:hypothetical protein
MKRAKGATLAEIMAVTKGLATHSVANGKDPHYLHAKTGS